MPRTVSYPSIVDGETGVVIARPRAERVYIRRIAASNLTIACDLTPDGWVPVAAYSRAGDPYELPPCFTLRPDWRDALNRHCPPNA